jgi:ATP-dependent DNA helicase RecQ
MLHQLVDQGLLERTPGDRPVLRLNDRSWEVLRGHLPVRLQRPKGGGVTKTRFDQQSWEGVDRGLFESLRELRRQLAEQRNVPPYVIFADSALRDMARLKPASLARFSAIHGVGEKKLKDLGPHFLERIREYCEENGLALSGAGLSSKTVGA